MQTTTNIENLDSGHRHLERKMKACSYCKYTTGAVTGKTRIYIKQGRPICDYLIIIEEILNCFYRKDV